MEIKTIAVFGGSGRTGLPFLKKAVQLYKIKALVRTPEKVNFTHENLSLIQGDIQNEKDILQTIDGCDAVVSLIGHVKQSPENLQSAAMASIIKIMKEKDLKRLVSLTGGGVRDPENDSPKFMDKAIVFIMKNLAGKGSKNALMDGINHAEIIKKSGLDWTIVRGPMLTENPETGNIEVGQVGKISGFKLTRADLAEFMLKIIQENSYVHQIPFLANA